MKLKTEAELKKALRAKRFDAGLRREAIRFSHAAAAGGETVTDTARRLGMKPNTLHRWRQRAGETEPPAFDFVEVDGAWSAGGLEVVWPSGHVVRMGAVDVKSVFLALEAACCPRG